MILADRWLLPDGVDELLPDAARGVEQLRRRLLDLFQVWGYEFVMPSLVEYTESLLVGPGDEFGAGSFKVVDELSGRLMAIRPDITPQAARIDAHSLQREGLVRLCYADTVLHTRPRSLLASRSPIQIGAEFFGEAGVAADIEVLCLMLASLRAAGLSSLSLDLGHVGILKALVREAGVDDTGQRELFDALQRKAADEVRALAERRVADRGLAGMLVELAGLHGGAELLPRARELLRGAPRAVRAAVDYLEQVAEEVGRRHPQVDCHFDLSELRGYHYHTGLVFAAYTPGHGQALANGGRYDDIGRVFGRARPATGFSLELKSLARLASGETGASAARIFAPYSDDLVLWERVQALRAEGRVVEFGPRGGARSAGCADELVLEQGEWRLRATGFN